MTLYRHQASNQKTSSLTYSVECQKDGEVESRIESLMKDAGQWRHTRGKGCQNRTDLTTNQRKRKGISQLRSSALNMRMKRMIGPLCRKIRAVSGARRGNRRQERGTWRISLRIRRIHGLGHRASHGTMMLNHSSSTFRSRNPMSSSLSSKRWNLCANTGPNLIKNSQDSRRSGCNHSLHTRCDQSL